MDKLKTSNPTEGEANRWTGACQGRTSDSTQVQKMLVEEAGSYPSTSLVKRQSHGLCRGAGRAGTARLECSQHDSRGGGVSTVCWDRSPSRDLGTRWKDGEICTIFLGHVLQGGRQRQSAVYVT